MTEPKHMPCAPSEAATCLWCSQTEPMGMSTRLREHSHGDGDVVLCRTCEEAAARIEGMERAIQRTTPEAINAADARIAALDRVAATIRRHSHQGSSIVAYQGDDVERRPCPACLALIAAGILREDEVGIQSRGVTHDTASVAPTACVHDLKHQPQMFGPECVCACGERVACEVHAMDRLT